MPEQNWKVVDVAELSRLASSFIRTDVASVANDIQQTCSQ